MKVTSPLCVAPSVVTTPSTLSVLSKSTAPVTLNVPLFTLTLPSSVPPKTLKVSYTTISTTSLATVADNPAMVLAVLVL